MWDNSKKSNNMKNSCRLFDFGSELLDYERVWKWQKVIAENINHTRKMSKQLNDALIVVQHTSTYTLGRGSSPTDNLKFSTPLNNHRIFKVERGGEVTWHGPGQIVMYPILDLNRHKKDLHWYMRSLEEVVIDCLKEFGIDGERNDINAGVWVGKNKISAVGVAASRWITMHGLALNVSCDMHNFQNIIPCGIRNPGYGVCSLKEIIPEVNSNDVRNKLIQSFSKVFDINLHHDELHKLDLDLLENPSIMAKGLSRMDVVEIS